MVSTILPAAATGDCKERHWCYPPCQHRTLPRFGSSYGVVALLEWHTYLHRAWLEPAWTWKRSHRRCWRWKKQITSLHPICIAKIRWWKIHLRCRWGDKIPVPGHRRIDLCRRDRGNLFVPSYQRTKLTRITISPSLSNSSSSLAQKCIHRPLLLKVINETLNRLSWRRLLPRPMSFQRPWPHPPGPAPRRRQEKP